MQCDDDGSVVWWCSLQHRRAMKLAAACRYKNRVDAKQSLNKRRAEEDKDLPQDPLDDLFAEPVTES